MLQVLIYKLNRVIKSCIDSVPLPKFRCNKIHLNSYRVFTGGQRGCDQTKLAHGLGEAVFLFSVVVKVEVSHIGSPSASCRGYALFGRW